MTPKVLVILLILQAASTPAVAENYLCIADAATGFYYDKLTNDWEISKFTVRGEKYILTTEHGKRVWKKFGDQLGVRACDEDQNYITCRIESMEQIKINKPCLSG